MLREQQIEIPDELDDFDEVQINAWICNNKVIRMVLNPFKPAKIPYMAALTSLTHIASLVLVLQRTWTIHKH